jgi:hypothetical protein
VNRDGHRSPRSPVSDWPCICFSYICIYIYIYRYNNTIYIYTFICIYYIILPAERVKCTIFWWSYSHAVMSVVNAQHSMPAQSLTSSGRMKKYIILSIFTFILHVFYTQLHASNLRGNTPHNCSMQPVFVVSTNALHVMSARACHLGKQFAGHYLHIT